jgi:hypothetical protein
MKKLLLSLIALTSLLVLAGCNNDNITADAETLIDAPLAIQNSFIDYGNIAMDQGEISMDFEIKNNGDQPVIAKRMYTSCMCTSATLSSEGKTSLSVGMQGHGGGDLIYKRIQPGETAIVTAIFDPNAHGPSGTGVNRRGVYIETNSSITPMLELGFTTTVFSTTEELQSNELFTS